MSSHDTPRLEPHQVSATHSRIIEETSELVLRACGLGSTQSSDQLNQIQQCESTPRRRGRPQQVSGIQLWSSLLLGTLQGIHSFAHWRRLLGLQEVRPVCGSRAVPATLAAFATDILCLDETRLDAVGRYLKPLRGLSAHDSACFAGKLVGLLDLRAEAVVGLPLSGEDVLLHRA